MSQTTRARPEAAGSFPGARTLFRVEGVPIRVDASWVLIAALVVWVFHSRLSVLLADRGAAVVIAASAAAALLFFASLLAHELGHALTSLDRDIPVVGVTLFLMGGVTESTREARTWRDEFVIVGIGPFISLVLAGAFGLASLGLSPWPVLAAVTGYLGWTNLLLAVFNLVPGYPLDGGRLLRSLLWAVTGRPHRATRWAARVGQVFALGLMGLGLWAFMRVAATGQGGFGGLWEILIGFFLLRGATQSHAQARRSEKLAQQRARDLMGSVPPALDGSMSVADAVTRLGERPSLLWPVGVPVEGAVSLQRVDGLAQHAWAATALRDLAYPAEVATVDADTPMDVVLDRIVHAPMQMLIVTEHGRPVGLLTPSLVTGATA